MYIDAFTTNWQEHLELHHRELIEGARLYLLLDGAFVPDLYRAVQATLPAGETVALLFESLPSCSDKTRAVSPFLIRYLAQHPPLTCVLDQCSRWPMVSAIETTESLTELAKRLAAWCIVENDGQRFNFRFPDIRRLPGIFDALTLPQRGSMTGPAKNWSYIGRDGTWKHLPIPVACDAVADRPRLDNQQFAAMENDNEVDEMLNRLQRHGPLPEGLRSEQYAIVDKALRLARLDKLDADLYLNWCDFQMKSGKPMDEHISLGTLASWRAAELGKISLDLTTKELK